MTSDQRAYRNAAAIKFYHRHRDRLLRERKEKKANLTGAERNRLKQRKQELAIKNAACVKEQRRLYRLRNHARIAAQKLAADRRNRVHVRDYQRKWAVQNHSTEGSKRRTYRWRIRLAAVAAYGGQCACCSETEPRFLTIDHIYNDGALERKSDRGRTGTKLYLWLKRNGWPKDRYQLLCFNCNCAKGQFGICPHQQKSKLAVAS